MSNPRTARLLGAAALALLAASCATRDARIRSGQQLFDSYPQDVQTAIRDGRIEVGFTVEMVRMALGDPEAVRRRVDSEGETWVWAYRSRRPLLGVGIGGGSYGGFGGLHAYHGAELRDEIVVTLEQEVVVEIEYLE